MGAFLFKVQLILVCLLYEARSQYLKIKEDSYETFYRGSFVRVQFFSFRR